LRISSASFWRDATSFRRRLMTLSMVPSSSHRTNNSGMSGATHRQEAMRLSAILCRAEAAGVVFKCYCGTAKAACVWRIKCFRAVALGLLAACRQVAHNVTTTGSAVNVHARHLVTGHAIRHCQLVMCKSKVVAVMTGLTHVFIGLGRACSAKKEQDQPN